MLKSLGRPFEGASRRLAQQFQAQLVERARAPVFFLEFGVPDTMDGRFDLVALHAFLALERLAAARMGEVAQNLTDALFTGFDEALREQGAGDMSMGRRMKAMANAYFGRMRAYGEARDEAAIAEALVRNLYRGKREVDEMVTALARYVTSARAALAASTVEQGVLNFGPLPAL